VRARPSTSKRGPVLYKTRYRSKLEERVADQLEAESIPFEYESVKLKYTVPARNATYTPDFVIDKKIFIETKGWMRNAAERQKMILVKQAYPDLDIRMVFQNANNPIYKGSQTTYAKWAEDHGIKWADEGKIPEDWLIEMREELKEIENG